MMLKIHKPNRKLLIIPIASILSISILLGFYGLTYTPELSHAETVYYPEKENRTLADITYMQDITPEICTNTPEADNQGNNQYQLKDSRDQKTYWVAKLKDDNCWMTQNLALDLSIDSPLTPEDSNVVRDWMPSKNTQYNKITSFPNTSNSDFSYNPGEYIYTTPMLQRNCNPHSTTVKNQLTGCPGWVLELNLSKNTIEDERSHYLIGNYYSYNIATTLNKVTSSSQAQSSICPKGWALPTGGNGSQFSMLAKDLTSSVSSAINNIKLAPYYFLYGGDISDVRIGSADGPYVISLFNTGEYGYCWSSTSYIDNAERSAAYYLYIANSNVLTGNMYATFSGRSIRCISLGGERPNNDNVEIMINSTISLDAADEVEVEKREDNPSTANLDVKVISNQSYTVQINTKEHPELTSSMTEVKIPSVSGLLNGNSNGWGIRKPGEENYTEVTNTAQVFYQSTVAEIKTIPFIVGISTSPDLPNGEYSTDITVTAAQN